MNQIQNWIRTARKTAARWLAVKDFGDSVQIGVSAEKVFTPEMFGAGVRAQIAKGAEYKNFRFADRVEADRELAKFLEEGWIIKGIDPDELGALPMMSGETRCYKSFRPTKVVMMEMVTATFKGDGLPDLVRAGAVEDARDLVLVSAFSGSDNCFPNAPSEANGIAGPMFSPKAFGNGVGWPVFASGSDVAIGLAVEPSVLFSVSWRCGQCGHGEHPKGYALTPASVKVKARMMFLGDRV